MKKIVIIAALSHPNYKEKIKNRKKNIQSFWNCALLKDGQPIDFVDFQKLQNKKNDIRHVYNNGIVLYNFFRIKKYNVHLINTFDNIVKEDIEKISKCDYIILSTTYPGYGDRLTNIIRTIKKIKEYNPQTKIVLGGWTMYHILSTKNNSHYELFLKNIYKAGANLVIGSRQGINIAWSNIKKDLNFQGIIYDSKDYPPINPTLYNTSSLPKKFHSSHTAVTTADGCPFSCNFCSYKLLHNKINRLSINNVKQILLNLHKGRINPLKHIRFADECFNYPYQRITKICQMINTLKFNFNWSCFIRIGNVDQKMVKIMKKTGCNFVSIGIESGDLNMRLRMNKNITNQEINKTIKLFKENGIKVVVSLIVGYYGENKKTIIETKKILEENKPDITRINIWSPTNNEDKTTNAQEFAFKRTKNGWSHSTMNEKQAHEKAAWLYKNTKNIVFSPPFISVFDLLPWLQGKGLDKEDSFNAVKKYYLKSLK